LTATGLTATGATVTFAETVTTVTRQTTAPVDSTTSILSPISTTTSEPASSTQSQASALGGPEPTSTASTGLSSGAIGGIVGGVLGGAFLIALGVIIFMVGKRMGRSGVNATPEAEIIPPGGRINKEETFDATENLSAADVENVDANVGGRLRYPTHDITTGARLGEVV
jgi:predicted lipid-binding transport protein (Tim44 family)